MAHGKRAYSPSAQKYDTGSGSPFRVRRWRRAPSGGAAAGPSPTVTDPPPETERPRVSVPPEDSAIRRAMSRPSPVDPPLDRPGHRTADRGIVRGDAHPRPFGFWRGVRDGGAWPGRRVLGRGTPPSAHPGRAARAGVLLLGGRRVGRLPRPSRPSRGHAASRWPGAASRWPGALPVGLVPPP